MNNKIERWITQGVAVEENSLLNALYLTAKAKDDLEFSYLKHELAIVCELKKRIETGSCINDDTGIYYTIKRRKGYETGHFIDQFHIARYYDHNAKKIFKRRRYQKGLSNKAATGTDKIFKFITSKVTNKNIMLNEVLGQYEALEAIWTPCSINPTIDYTNRRILTGKFYIINKEYDNIIIDFSDFQIKTLITNANQKYTLVHDHDNYFSIKVLNAGRIINKNNLTNFEYHNGWYTFGV